MISSKTSNRQVKYKCLFHIFAAYNYIQDYQAKEDIEIAEKYKIWLTFLTFLVSL